MLSSYPQTKMVDSKIILEIIKNNPNNNWRNILLLKDK
jgi:hypothetical protein